MMEPTALREKLKIAVYAVLVCLLIVAATYGVFLFRRNARLEQEQKVQKVIEKQVITMYSDSMQTAIEHRLQDSIRANFNRLELQLKKIQNENYAYRKKNYSVQARFDSIAVNRPDF